MATHDPPFRFGAMPGAVAASVGRPSFGCAHGSRGAGRPRGTIETIDAGSAPAVALLGSRLGESQAPCDPYPRGTQAQQLAPRQHSPSSRIRLHSVVRLTPSSRAASARRRRVFLSASRISLLLG